MKCENCGANMVTDICSICGYDRAMVNAKYEVINKKRDRKRSLFMIYEFIEQIWASVSLAGLSLNVLISDSKVNGILIVFLILSVTRIIFCISTFFFNKWGFYALVVNIILFSISYTLITSGNIIIPAIDITLNIILFWGICSKDWHKFK